MVFVSNKNYPFMVLSVSFLYDLMEILITQARKSHFICFVQEQIFNLFIMHDFNVKEDKAGEYLEIDNKIDKTFTADELVNFF